MQKKFLKSSHNFFMRGFTTEKLLQQIMPYLEIFYPRNLSACVYL